MNWMRANNLAGNADEGSNFCSGQLSDFVTRWHLSERHIALLFLLQVAAILDKVGDRLAQEWEDSTREKFKG